MSCSVCLLDNPDVITPCGHTFHLECMNIWHHTHVKGHTCPVCRNDIRNMNEKFYDLFPECNLCDVIDSSVYDIDISNTNEELKSFFCL